VLSRYKIRSAFGFRRGRQQWEISGWAQWQVCRRRKSRILGADMPLWYESVQYPPVQRWLSGGKLSYTSLDVGRSDRCGSCVRHRHHHVSQWMRHTWAVDVLCVMCIVNRLNGCCRLMCLSFVDSWNWTTRICTTYHLQTVHTLYSLLIAGIEQQ